MSTHLHHLHHTIICFHHLCHSTTSPFVSHHRHHITNSSNHLHHLCHNSTPQIPSVHSPAIYNSHHGLQITEPHLHLNITKTPILTNFSCATKLPLPQPEGMKPPLPNPSSSLSRIPPQTVTPGSRQDASILGNNSKKVLARFSGFPSRAQHERRFYILRKRKRNTPQFIPEVLTAKGSSSRSIRRSSHHLGYQSLVGGASAQPSCQGAAQNSAGAL
jgi:hypothetical protein